MSCPPAPPRAPLPTKELVIGPFERRRGRGERPGARPRCRGDGGPGPRGPAGPGPMLPNSRGRPGPHRGRQLRPCDGAPAQDEGSRAGVPRPVP